MLKLANLHLIVKYLYKFHVTDPCYEVLRPGNTILFLYLHPEVVNFVILFDFDFQFLVTILSGAIWIQMVLDKVARLSHPFGAWDWHSGH